LGDLDLDLVMVHGRDHIGLDAGRLMWADYNARPAGQGLVALPRWSLRQRGPNGGPFRAEVGRNNHAKAPGVGR